MKRKKGFRFGIGIISIFMIFIVLCFTILACISYMKAMDDEAIGKQQVAYTNAYYQADGKARVIQAKLQNIDVTDEATLMELDKLGVTYRDNTFSYQVKINDQQSLSVILQNDGEDLSIISWKTVSGKEVKK